MTGKRLVLHGKFVEAYLYFDFLWLFANDGSIRAFDIAAFCAERLNGEGAAANALFSDNRLLEDPTSQLRYKAERLLKAGGQYDVSSADVDQFSYIFEDELAFRSLLDVKFYYGRAYIGTDSSVVQLTAINQGDMRDQRGATARSGLDSRKLSDLPARAFHCRFGAVGAACGAAGGLIGFGADSDAHDWELKFDLFADRSYGVAINGRAVTNLSGRNKVQIYQATLEPRRTVRGTYSEELETDRQLRLTGISKTPLREPSDRVNMLAERNESTGLFLFNKTIWQFDADGQSRRANLMGEDLELGTIDLTPLRKGPPGRVLSMSSMDAGVIAETDDAVFLQLFGRWTSLLEEPVHSVRGYQSSKRYQRVATAVVRDRVEIIAL